MMTRTIRTRTMRTRTIKQEDMNLQLFDLDFVPDFELDRTYELPDRISFGNPGRLFED